MANVHCAAEGCVSDSRKRGKYGYMASVRFHPFPTKKREPKQRKKWLELLRRADYDPPGHHRLCSLHFIDGEPTTENPYPSLFAYNNFKNPSLPRSTTAIEKRSKEKMFNAKPPESVERMQLIHMDTDNEMYVPVIREEIVHTEILQMSSTQQPLCYKDHTYVERTVSTTPCSHEMETQTDITLEDMKEYENAKNKMDRPADLLRDLFVKEVTSSDDNVRKYLGLPSVMTLLGIFAILEKASSQLKYWRGASGTNCQNSPNRENHAKRKTGPRRKLGRFHEFLLTLLRIRLALPSFVLAGIFGVSVSRVSQIFSTWVNFLYSIFLPLLKWPDTKRVRKFMPRSFKNAFPRTTCIIDCTEFHVEKPSTPTAQLQTYSSYKHKNTFKALVSITPTGAFNFVSNLWGGNVSDRYITEHCGFLDNIKPGDEVMADRGFLIRDLLLERHATLNIPPFTKKCSWGKKKCLSSYNIKRTRKIAKLRIHVERAIGRLKNYKILSNTMPLKLKPLASQILKICAFLSNIQTPLLNN